MSFAELLRYESVNTELTYNSNWTVLLKTNRLMIPCSLSEKLIDIALEGHLNVVKIDTPASNREPLKPTKLPGSFRTY